MALLAVLALNLQGSQPYSPGMLQDPELCATRPGTTPSPGDTKALHHAGCLMCCAHAQVPVVPGAAATVVVLVQAAETVVAPATADPTASRAWSPSRPRGPPSRA